MGNRDGRGEGTRLDEGRSHRRQLHTLQDRVGDIDERTRRLERQFAMKAGGDLSFTTWIGKEVLLMDVQGNQHTGILRWVDKYHIGVQLYGEDSTSDPATFTKGNLIKVEPVVR